MSTTYATRTFLVLALLATLGPAVAVAAEPAHKAWLKDWQKKNTTWRAMHLIGPRPELLPVTEQFVADVLRPMGFNVLILEVNWL